MTSKGNRRVVETTPAVKPDIRGVNELLLVDDEDAAAMVAKDDVV